MEIQKRLGIATALLGASFPHSWNFTPLMRLFAAIGQVFLPRQQAA
jgi:hypothetical protein